MLSVEGKIELDDDIHTILSEVPDFGFPITFRHLVHHTSGIRDWPGTLSLAGWRMDDMILFAQIMRMVEYQRDLSFMPGDEYLYSNTGYNLLAETIARISGKTFREWTEQHLFHPLGMMNTHFHDDHQEVVKNRAWAYFRDEGEYKRLENGLTALGSSSLFTTVDDLVAWVNNFEEKHVGGEEALKLMHDRGILNNGRRIAYAFGQNIGTYKGLKTVSHGGSWAGFRTFLLRFPEEHFAVIVLGNASRFRSGPAAYGIADLFIRDRLNSRKETPRTNDRPDITVDTLLLEKYVGTYRLGLGWYVTITREEDKLFAQASREDKFEMSAKSKTEFWVEAYGASIVFRKGKQDNISHFRYRGMDAPRVIRVKPTREELVQYIGSYFSPELRISYAVIQEGESLVVRHPKYDDVSLIPITQDTFESGIWWMKEVVFSRDTDGRIDGLFVTSGRSRNQRFDRMSL